MNDAGVIPRVRSNFTLKKTMLPTMREAEMAVSVAPPRLFERQRTMKIVVRTVLAEKALGSHHHQYHRRGRIEQFNSYPPQKAGGSNPFQDIPRYTRHKGKNQT